MAALDEVEFDHWNFQRTVSNVKNRRMNGTTDLVQNIIDDIVKMSKKGNNRRWDTLFFQIVQGGNISIIKQTLDRLKNPDLYKERSWILDQNASQDIGAQKYQNCTSVFGKIVTFIILGLLYILFTPVFYICHTVASYFKRSFIPSSCEHINHPLYLVCRSKSVEMIELFLEEGMNIYHADQDGNTILHHFVHHSVKDAEGAKEMWNSLLKVYKDCNLLVLCSQTNRLGLDALEYNAMIGSLDFLALMMDSEVMRSVDLWVDSHTVSMDNTTTRNGPVNDTPEGIPINGFVRSRYDITKYEIGNLRNFSSLLNLLSHRDISGKKSDSTEVVLHNSILGTWIGMKNSMLFPIRVFSNLYSVLFSILILIYMAILDGDANPVPLGHININLLINIADSAAQAAHNVSDISQYTVYKMFYDCWQPNSFFGSYDTQSWCQLQTFEILSKQCYGQLTDEDLPYETGLVPKSETEAIKRVGSLVLMVLMSLYLFYDLVMRLAYLWNCVMTPHLGIQEGVNKAICVKLPGSYTAKQVNVFSFSLFCAFLGMLFIFERSILPQVKDPGPNILVSTYVSYFTEMVDYVKTMSLLTTLCMIFRMISFVFMLRLVPKLGHFIVLTFKMTTVLLSFLVVYFIILVAFGSLFHFLLRDPQCPSLRVVNFQTITESCYQAFLLMLGMSEFPKEHSSLARGTYIFYLLISAVVLLNLIIAIMSSLVEEINEQPTKRATHLMLHLDDALAAETWLNIVTGPCSKSLRCWMLNKAGFHVIENGGHKKNQELSASEKHSVCITVLQKT